jgi:hypothetical protein
MITSAVATEFTGLYPASAKHPAKTSPSAKFVEQPKLLMKMRIVLHRDTLNGLTRNKNIRVAGNQNLQKFETLFVQCLNREERTCLKHI